MKLLPAILIFISYCAFFELALAEDTIRNDDIIIVKGSVKYCEGWGQFVAWRTRVVDDVIEIDGHKIRAAGLSPEALHESLSSVLGPELGTLLSAVNVEVMSSEEYKHQKIDMCESGLKMRKALDACEKEMIQFQERQKKVAAAAYNKSLKFVPPASLAPPDAYCVRAA